MPLYDYFCKGCGREEKDIMVDYDKEVTCPECSETMTREMPAASFTFKDPALTKHLHKFGNNSENVKPIPGNGVNIYAKPKRR